METDGDRPDVAHPTISRSWRWPGIIDPLRAEAKSAVTIALAAGIDVRMITGDHAVTAQAIGASLGLGPGAISGAELRKLSDDELRTAASRSCTSSAGSPPRTSSGWRGPCRRAA